MVIRQGDRVHIVTRRLFEEDLRRHFVGVVEEVSEGLSRVTGYAFVWDESDSEFVRTDDALTRIFALSSSGLIVTLLPEGTDVGRVVYALDEQGRRVVKDGSAILLNVTEFGADR